MRWAIPHAGWCSTAFAPGPCSVATLAEGLPVSRPAVSQHLKILKQAGLVTDEAIGARRIYRVESGRPECPACLAGRFAEMTPWIVYQAEIQRQMDERKNT